MAVGDGEADGRLRDWLALVRVPGIGAVTFGALLRHFGTPGDVLRAGHEALAATGLLNRRQRLALKRPLDEAVLARELEWITAPGHDCLTLHDPRYPRLLAEIPGPPPLLYVEGDVEVLSTLQLAIVGSRNPTPDGLAIARAFARGLAHAGLTITSGLALGIDAAAHGGALSAEGRTVGVLGCGLDIVYPYRHRGLARDIAGRGALVSEFPLGTRPRPENFPRRNRIISGLSLGVLVVEATPRSGSLRTAAYAAEQGRELFAVPGSIHNPQSRGCHRLIRQGGKLTESVEDVLEELAPLAGVVAATVGKGGCKDEPAEPEVRTLLYQMGYAPIDIDTLAERSNLPVARISTLISLLELENRVISLPGGHYLRCHAQDDR